MNQKTKIFTAGFVLILGAVLLSGAGCVKVTGVPTGQFTDKDKCIELLAHTLLAPSYGQNMAALLVLQQKIDTLKKQYGWSDENIANTCQTLYTQNYSEKDFMEQLGKRMKELSIEIK